MSLFSYPLIQLEVWWAEGQLGKNGSFSNGHLRLISKASRTPVGSRVKMLNFSALKSIFYSLLEKSVVASGTRFPFITTRVNLNSGVTGVAVFIDRCPKTGS